jgi:sugar diacid utilization regulator
MSIEQIQSLVDALASRLRRAVVVDDKDLRLIAVSEDFGDADAARIWSLLHRRTRPEDVAYAEIRQLAGPVRIPENPALELWQRLCVPIRCQGLLLGFTWITDRYGDLTDDQIADAAHTAEAMGVLLHRRLVMTTNDLQIRQHLVEQLLSEDPAARRAAREEALDRGLLDDGQAAVIVAGYRDGADEGLSPAVQAAFSVAVERFCRVLARTSALAAFWPRRATVVLVRLPGFADGDLAAAGDALLAELKSQPPPAGRWRVGVSGPASGLLELATAQRQASIACSLAADSAAACWSRLSADALLAQLASPAQQGAIIPDGVLALLADPAAHILVPTVETFLDCAGEVQRAARELRVHRTTLYYRLGRAEQISGLNLRDGRDRLLLHLVLGLRRVHGTPGVPSLPAASSAGLPTDAGDRPRNLQRRAG